MSIIKDKTSTIKPLTPIQLKKYLIKQLNIEKKELKSELLAFKRGDFWPACIECEGQIAIIDYIIDKYLK